jgi:hypothetical protein
MHFRLFFIFPLFIILCLLTPAKAQLIPSSDTGLDEVIEALAEQTDAELDYTEFVERLYEIANDPINLNTATEEELQDLIFLTDFQIYNLLNYRKAVTQVYSIYELQYVYGFDEELTRLIIPFVFIGEPTKEKTNWGNVFKYARHDVFLRYERVLEKQAGYDEIPDSILLIEPDKSRFLGSPDKLYLRYKYHFKDKISIGFTAEKDAGEQFFQGAQKYGFDFYSGHLQVQDIGVFQRINLGDYSVQFGQGLVAWSSMSFGKTPYVMDVARKARGISRYTSTNENQFLRGAAASLKFDNFEASAFFSYKPIDANIDQTDTLDNIQTVSSFQNVGYHRTPSENFDRKVINEMIAGGNLNYSYKNLRLGSTIATYHYSAELSIPNQTYRLYDFRGTQFSNLGVDFRWQFKKLSLFGEIAINDASYLALVSGLSANIAPQMDLSLVYRNFQAGYFAGYASGFGESGSLGNENGLFIGTEISLFPNWKFRGYFDMFSFPWLTYQANSPSEGFDWFAQVDYNMSRSVSMFWRFKAQEKEQPLTPLDSYLGLMLPEKSFKARYSVKIQADNFWRLKTQIEYNRFTPNTGEQAENGYLLSQDLIYRLPNFPLQLTGRFAVFRTDSYNARIYAYEYDVLYAFSIPAYYYHGKRTYFLLKYSPSDKIDIWFRIARTYFDNKDVISSGLTEIDSPHKTDIKVQIRYKF